MDLPTNIEIQIIDYLNMEYGIYKEAEKLNTSDLNFIGSTFKDGKEIKYWKYPCSDRNGCWATVEEYEDGYMISVTTKKPCIK